MFSVDGHYTCRCRRHERDTLSGISNCIGCSSNNNDRPSDLVRRRPVGRSVGCEQAPQSARHRSSSSPRCRLQSPGRRAEQPGAVAAGRLASQPGPRFMYYSRRRGSRAAAAARIEVVGPHHTDRRRHRRDPRRRRNNGCWSGATKRRKSLAGRALQREGYTESQLACLADWRRRCRTVATTVACSWNPIHQRAGEQEHGYPALYLASEQATAAAAAMGQAAFVEYRNSIHSHNHCS